MTINEVMTKDMVTCRDTDSLSDAASLMREISVGSLPVMDEVGSLIGMITDRDIAIRAVSTGVDPVLSQVGDFMTPNPLTISPDSSLEIAAEMMANAQVRRLPVIQDGQLVGIVSLGDLAVDLGEEELLAETLGRISMPVR
jgi:CBS domain-containing protein